MTQPVLVMSTVQAVLEFHTQSPSPIARLVVQRVSINEMIRVMCELRSRGFLEPTESRAFRLTRLGRALLGDPR